MLAVNPGYRFCKDVQICILRINRRDRGPPKILLILIPEKYWIAIELIGENVDSRNVNEFAIRVGSTRGVNLRIPIFAMHQSERFWLRFGPRHEYAHSIGIGNLRCSRVIQKVCFGEICKVRLLPVFDTLELISKPRRKALEQPR